MSTSSSFHLRPMAFALLSFGGSALGQASCNLTFSRFSKQDVASWLGSVEHAINMKSYEDGAPDVPYDSSSCWQIVNWGAGCSWGRPENTTTGAGYTIDHQSYDVFGDYADSITVYGNGCDGTVLSCTASHSHYALPNPGDPNGGGQQIYISNTDCALETSELTALVDDGVAGSEADVLLYLLLNEEGNTDGFNNSVGLIESLTVEPEVTAPAPYTCDYFPEGEDNCVDFWECVDDVASVTAYFAGTVALSSTMSTNPPEAPTASPGPC